MGERMIGPYQLNTIIQGDCLEAMPRIPDGSVDMILGDWPYGTTACEWDSIIPLEPLWKECKRVIKPGGAIVLTASQPFTSVLVMSNINQFRYEWVWDKRSPVDPLNVKIKPMPVHESVLIFSEGWPYNPQFRSDVLRKPQSGVTVNGKQNQVYGPAGNIRNFGVGYPMSIISTPRPTTDKLHPTQKPVGLFAYLIRTYSNPGDLVLDSAAGSCTTAIAAIETGRNWLCIEKEARYVEIGRERVRERMSQPFLPGLVEALPAPIQFGFEGMVIDCHRDD